MQLLDQCSESINRIIVLLLLLAPVSHSDPLFTCLHTAASSSLIQRVQHSSRRSATTILTRRLFFVVVSPFRLASCGEPSKESCTSIHGQQPFSVVCSLLALLAQPL